jgi:hypothetical protein
MRNRHTEGATVRVSFDCIVGPVFGKAGLRRQPKHCAPRPFNMHQREEPVNSMMNLTLLLSFRIALVWAGGFLIAVAVQALLPDQAGINLTGKQSVLFIPFSRMGFWTCVLAALIVTALVVGRAMLADIGWNTFR